MLIIALFFIALRLIAYVSWCFAGVMLGSPAGKRRWLLSVVLSLCLGVLRLLLGLVVHYAIFDASKLLPFMRLKEELLWSYLAIIVPLRLMMWLVILLIATYLVQKTAAPALAAGGQKYIWWKPGLAWVAGGTVLSCLLDIPLIGLERNFSR